MMLTPGKNAAPPLTSASAVFHVVKGQGSSRINGRVVEWGPKDVFSVPVFARIEHSVSEEAFLIRVHDRPLQQKLGYYEERDQ